MLKGNEIKDFDNLPGKPVNRRNFSMQLAALFSGLGFAGAAFASSKLSRAAGFPAAEEISRSAEAIHQEVNFSAAPARVYDALTDAKQFNQVVQLSAAMKSMSISNKPVEMSGETGGAFSAFGGYVTGRQLELVPGQRIVQAWRAGSWASGAYSIARFELSPQDSGTKLTFDHAGFPQGQAEHLLTGWKTNYWEPLAKFLAGAK
ncbi:MAG: SRPBCC domain-containing protein [Candidatus Acidiferrum sp.]